MNVFSSDFMVAIKSTLNGLRDKESVTRSGLLERAGFTADESKFYEPVISMLMAQDAFPGYQLKKGRFGGVSRIPPKTEEVVVVQSVAKAAQHVDPASNEAGGLL